jgi:hypothetical protein
VNAPNGWFINDLLIWNELDHRGFAAKGFSVETPDLANASHSFLNQFQDVVRNFLRSLDQTTRAQWLWTIDSDYKAELLVYDRFTKAHAGNGWAAEVRRERFERYWQAMAARKLRRERLHVFLSRPITVPVQPGLNGQKLQEHYLRVVGQLAQWADHHGHLLRDVFGSVGCRVHSLNNAGHHRLLSAFLNPSYAGRLDFDPHTHFDPSFSIQANSWRSECRGGSVFHSDGHYHQMLVLRRPPQTTYPGIIRRLLDQSFLDYSITVNVYPQSIRREVEKEERGLERLRGDYASEGRHSLLTSIEKKQRKISNLTLGAVHPFAFDFIIRVWDPTPEGLASKTAALKEAIHGMAGADYFEPNLATTSKNLWCQSWPGWIWGKYAHHALYAEDSWLADLLPFSSTFTGHLSGAEAVYDGANGNLVGIRTRIADTPQLAVVLGMTRAGKSGFINDLLSQTAPSYDFTLILEEGLSYADLTEKIGSHAIRVSPDGELTLNYFDTQGAPLTNLQIESAAALVLQMTGACADEDKRRLRLARIGEYIDALYTDVFELWARDHDLDPIARTVLAVRRIQKECLPPGATFLEGWTILQEWQRTLPESTAKLLASFSADDVARAVLDPDNQVRNAAYAMFAPEQFPTHWMLYEHLRNTPLDHHDRQEIKDLASLVRPWCDRKLVSGPSTFSFKQPWVHFDLTAIPEAATDLKSLVGFLVANQVRQHIITLPRRAAKRVIFEEVGRTLDVPGGERLVSEFYAQMSKFNVWIAAIVQQYGKFKHSSIRSTVMGNAKQFFLLRQNDRADVDEICRDIDLPEPAREAVVAYALPEHMPEEAKFASMTYYHVDARQPVCGTIRNRASPEMLAVASSSPADFDSRQPQPSLLNL